MKVELRRSNLPADRVPVTAVVHADRQVSPYVILAEKRSGYHPSTPGTCLYSSLIKGETSAELHTKNLPPRSSFYNKNSLKYININIYILVLVLSEMGV